MEIITLVLSFLQNQLCCVTYHEVLLVDTEETTIVITIIRIEEEGHVLLDVCLIEVDGVISNYGIINRV